MNRKWLANVISATIFFFICITPIRPAFALEQDERLWTQLVIQQPFSQDEKWQYLFFTAMRFVNQSHPWQTTLLEGGVGRVLAPGHFLWAGYRWTANNPNNNFFQSNMLWQQYIAEMKNDTDGRMFLRSRLEEILRGNASPVSFRLRERFYIESRRLYHGLFNPVIYDEVFFQLNETSFTSTNFISENRLFLGFNLMTNRTAFWEIGYINQYQFSTPLMLQNRMSHVIAVTYIII